MLNEPSQPEDQPTEPTQPTQPTQGDLPDTAGSPFTAVPQAFSRPAVPPPPAASIAAPASKPRGSRSFRTVTAAVVLALVAVAAFAAWRIGTIGGSTPVAGPTATASRQPTTPASPSSPPTPAPPAPTPAPVTRDWAPALNDFYTQTVSWKKCSSVTDHRCGTVEVPVDYSRPKGDRFTLALRKVSATSPTARIGSLLINPGGPGGNGLEYAQYSSFVFSPQVRASYDIIGFDPRGMGESSPVGCLRDRDMDLLFSDDPTPDTPAEKAKLLADADAITKGCAERGGERARHMSTAEVARDMDVIRVLVGDNQLNYFGVSYGTLLGALYADQFPKKVGRLVLDSAISPNQTDTQELTYDIQGFESSIDAFINWCVPRSDCALGSDKAAARGKIVAVLDQVERKGLRTSTPTLPTVGEGWVGFGMFMCLYDPQDWPVLNRGLTQAMAGTGDALLEQANKYVQRSDTGKYSSSTYLQAMIPVRCADWPRSPPTPARLAEQTKLKQDHPLWARMTGELYDNCKTWPTTGRTPKTSKLAIGAAPILVIGNLRDPATPIGGTKALAADLASGTLVTSDHDGHGTYFAGSSCVDSAVDGYLLRGDVPQKGLAC